MNYICRFKIRFSDTDAYGIVHHSAYYNYFEFARFLFSVDELGFDITMAATEKFPVIESSCQYRRPLKFTTQDYKASVSLKIIDETKLEFSYVILDESEKIKYAIGKTVHVYEDHQGKFSTEFPSFIKKKNFESVDGKDI